MLQYLLFGPLKEPAHDHHGHSPAPAVRDMGLREMLALAPIALGCLWIGVRPQPVVDSIKTEIAAIAALYDGEAQSLATTHGPNPLAAVAATNEEGR
jgi:NADH-quinone oxidoreductase subunit M